MQVALSPCRETKPRYGGPMSRTLHILRSEPDETIETLVSALGGEGGTAVVCLYCDDVSMVPVDWDRLLDDIFVHDHVICWG